MGVVTAISDPDGDVDDEGRSVFYPPKITVCSMTAAPRISRRSRWRGTTWTTTTPSSAMKWRKFHD